MAAVDCKVLGRLVRGGTFSRGRSMGDLARALGMTDSKLSNLLAGRRHAPDDFLAVVFRQFLAWDAEDAKQQAERGSVGYAGPAPA